jgi:hypothetical protein
VTAPPAEHHSWRRPHTGLLPEEHGPRIFTRKRPQPDNAFLVDGRVAGAWRYGDGSIDLDPFERLNPGVLRALREEGQRLAAFSA